MWVVDIGYYTFSGAVAQTVTVAIHSDCDVYEASMLAIDYLQLTAPKPHTHGFKCLNTPIKVPTEKAAVPVIPNGDDYIKKLRDLALQFGKYSYVTETDQIYTIPTITKDGRHY